MLHRTAIVLCLDTTMLMLVCVLECLRLTGLELHVWLGFALCPLLLVHVVLQWQWFTTQFQKILRPGAYRARLNAVLNGLLMVLMSAVLASGALTSRQGTSIIGEHLGSVDIWREVHGWLNFALVTLVGLHLALNWDWTLSALRRLRPERPANASSISERRSLSWAKLLGRSLATILGAFVCAGFVYFSMAPMIRSPKKRLETERARAVATDAIVQRSQLAPQPRSASLPDGLQKLMVTAGIVAFLVVVGRYVFRLRL
jgi:cytochrome b561